jgi:galactokinase
VHAPDRGALLLDCRSGEQRTVPWNVEAALVVCATPQGHDVGGAGYRQRRSEAAEALRCSGAASFRDIGLASLAQRSLPAPLDRRLRHIVSETARAGEAALALERGDDRGLGALLSTSHASLRDDYEVSTPELDRVAGAARAVPGCHGARLVASADVCWRWSTRDPWAPAVKPCWPPQRPGPAGGGQPRRPGWRCGIPTW